MRFFVVFCLAVMLMFSEHQFERMKVLRMQLSVIVYPIQEIVNFPINIYHLWYDYFILQKTLIDENNRLKAEQFILKGKLQRFDAIELENFRLKELLNSAITAADELLVASILKIDPDPFMHQIILDKGTNYGVYVGQPVIDAHGIMGSVIEVNDLTSRVMLLTDASHAVPVEDTRNSVRAIAMGTGVTDYLELKHVTNTTDIAIGDKLVTSGLDGKYPAGYPVGIVNSVEHDASKPFASIYIAPSAELERGRQVLLIKSRDKHGTKKD
jgi:rod shape-determining protein MreC